MSKDRNYYRMMHECELSRYALDNPTTDLELVLAERLSALIDVEDRLEEAQMTVEDLQTEIAELKADIERQKVEIDLLACELHDMEGTNLV